MDMKKLLSIVEGNVEKKQLNENIEECGMPMPSSPSSPGNISMNMSMNASGVDNIKQLLDLIKAASSPGRMSEPMAMPSPGMDMPISITKIKPAGDDGDRGMAQIRDLIAKADSPKPFENSPEEGYADVDAVTTDAGGGPNAPKHPADIRIKDPSPYAATSEEFANEPDEKVSDHYLMIKDLAGGLNKEKQQYKKEYPGDNPMAVREEALRNQLSAMWKEIKEGQVYEVDVDQPGAIDNTLPPPDMKPAAAPAGDDVPTISAPNFNAAYAQAVKQGLKKFKWCGTYAVKNAPAKPKAKPAINVPMEPQRRQFGGLNPNVELGPQSGSDLPIAP